MSEKNNNKENFAVEAVPGPAIILTKQEAEKVKNSKSNLTKEQKLAQQIALKKIKEQIERSKKTNEPDLSK